MRRLLLATIVGVFFLAPGQVREAHAFGDTCKRDVSARGAVQSSMSAARGSAIDAWEQSVRQRDGARFASWWYSGDRTVDCTWDASGRRIRCVAQALPCGRKSR